MDLSELPVVKIERFAKVSDVPWQIDLDCGFDDRGSHSVVYRARRGNEAFALKAMRPPKSTTQMTQKSLIESVMTELQLLKICDHPNVLKYVAAYTNDKTPDHVYLVSQPWADMNLSDFLGNGYSLGTSSGCSWWNSKDPFDRCCHLFKGLLDGLAYLHSHSIFHKDIKPDNILFVGDRPILADFGVSKLYRPGGKTGYTNSTFDYLSPEQIGHVSSTPQSDVFAMGCCFLRIMSISVGGAQELHKVNEIFYMNDTSCQYGNPRTISRLVLMLKEQTLKSLASSWQTSNLGLLIRDMLVQDPSKRATSSRLVTLLRYICNAEIKQNSLVHLPSRISTLEAAISSDEFLDPEICVLNAVVNYEERIRQVDPWSIKLYLDERNGTEMIIIASLDTTSSNNLVSSSLIDRLTAQNSPLEFETVDITLTSGGATTHISRSVKLEVRVSAKKLFIPCLVLDKAEAYFTILLGKEGIAAVKESRKLLPIYE